MEAQIDKVVSARAELERANARFLLDIRVKLTPDQWKQLRQTRMGGMNQNGPNPGTPGSRMQQWRDRRNGPGAQTPPGAAPQGNSPNGPPAAGPGQGPGGNGEEQ
jgi:hypothetical protein